MKTSRLLVVLFATLAGPLTANDNVALKAAISDITIAANGAIPPIDQRNHFEVTGVQGTVVHFDTNFGAFNVEMFDSTAPNTVANFLRYVNEARYTDSIVHRSETQSAAPGFQVIQGGGFLADTNVSAITPLTNCNTNIGSTTVTCQDTSNASVGMTVTGAPLPPGTTITAITSGTTFVISAPAITTKTGQTFTIAHPAIDLETDITTLNSRGTIGMARTGDPNSATKEWFINVGDNSLAFPPASDDGYAVFGRVVGAGMNVADAIAALPIVNALGFAHLPYTGTLPAPNPDGTKNVSLSNFVRVNSMTSGPVFPTANGQSSYVRFTLTNTNPGLVQASLDGSTLNLPVTPNQGGSAKLQIVATDAEGKTATIPLSITVTGGSGTKSDLTGDAIDDLIFQNDAGQIVGWRMDGAAANAGAFWITTGGLADWKVVAKTDVNGDGFTDLILQNTIGQVYVWLMDGSGGLAGAQWVMTSPMVDWRVVGAADMNRDGTPDIVLRNSAGQLAAWLTDGKGGITDSVWVCLDWSADWQVVAVTDVNRDAINDIVFQNEAGQIVVWLLDGSGKTVNLSTGQGLKNGVASYLYTGILGTWRVATFADVNNDGIPDIIFQNREGRVFVWCLDGSGGTVNPANRSGLKPGTGYIYDGKLGDWRVR